MVKKILFFSVDEPLGGFDLESLQQSLSSFFDKNYKGKFSFILLNGVKPVSKDELKELLK